MKLQFRSHNRPHDHLFTMRVLLTGGALVVHGYDANHTDPRTGHMQIDVEAAWNGQPLFRRGDTYCAVNRWTSIDSDAAKALVLSLLAMKPGDTDRDYFVGYTPEQLEWASEHGEELTLEQWRRFGEDS